MPSVTQTKSNMLEKLAWAERSLARMDQAKQASDNTAVQDHFWSLLHACHLIWFYLGEFLQSRGDPKGAAKRLLEQWQTKNLSNAEQSTWALLVALRTEDVHTKPVATGKKKRLVCRDGKLLVSGNIGPCVVTVFVVNYDGKEHDAFHVARTGVGILRRFVEDFDTLV